MIQQNIVCYAYPTIGLIMELASPHALLHFYLQMKSPLLVIVMHVVQSLIARVVQQQGVANVQLDISSIPQVQAYVKFAIHPRLCQIVFNVQIRQRVYNVLFSIMLNLEYVYLIVLIIARQDVLHVTVSIVIHV